MSKRKQTDAALLLLLEELLLLLLLRRSLSTRTVELRRAESGKQIQMGRWGLVAFASITSLTIDITSLTIDITSLIIDKTPRPLGHLHRLPTATTQAEGTKQSICHTNYSSISRYFTSPANTLDTDNEMVS